MLVRDLMGSPDHAIASSRLPTVIGDSNEIDPPRMKILQVSTFAYPDQMGGAERTIDGMARAQVKLGHDVTLLTGARPGAPASEVREGVRVLRYPIVPARGIGLFRAIRAGIRQRLRELAGESFDMLHSHQLPSSFAALTAEFPARRVLSFHAAYRLESEAERLNGTPAASVADLFRAGHAKSLFIDHLDRQCLLKAERIVVHSRFVRDQVGRLDGAALARVRVVPPGIDLDRLHPDSTARLAARAALGVPPGRPLLVTSRRLVRRVGVDLLLEALAILRGRGIVFSAIISGDGTERRFLEGLRSRLGLEDDVRFTGRISDDALLALYRAADVFALPTRSLEGFGLSTLEALACGTPVVATNVGATPELIGALGGGLLTPPEAEAFADGLARVLADPAGLRRAAHEASRRVHEGYGWAARAGEIEDVYREILGSGREEEVLSLA